MVAGQQRIRLIAHSREAADIKLERAVNLIAVGGNQRAGMHHAEYLLVPEMLTHVRGSARTIGPIAVALVNPFADLLGNLDGLLISHAAGAVFLDNFHAVVGKEGFKVLRTPARKDHRPARSGTVSVEFGRLLHESVHILPLFR